MMNTLGIGELASGVEIDAVLSSHCVLGDHSYHWH